MGRVTRRIFKRRVDIGSFKVGEVLQDLFRRYAPGKHFKHMAHRDAHAANRQLTTTHVGLIVIRSICSPFYKNLRRTQSDFKNPFSAPHVPRCFASYLRRVLAEKIKENGLCPQQLQDCLE